MLSDVMGRDRSINLFAGYLHTPPLPSGGLHGNQPANLETTLGSYETSNPPLAA